ncbi:DUF550 domain-containing protein [Salmonella enterica]|nr:DUF550 domain-containing protein [Salmonella enterica]
MTTITRERLLKIQQWRETYGTGSNVMLPAEEAEELARIALASLTAEPVAWRLVDSPESSVTVTDNEKMAAIWKRNGRNVQPLYSTAHSSADAVGMVVSEGRQPSAHNPYSRIFEVLVESGYEPVPGDKLYAAPPASERERIRREHAEWSDATFGDVGPIGPLKHLSKEALEAVAEPDDLSEWADMQFLLWDAQRRAGITDEQITQAMIEKLAVNKQREWPTPKDGEPQLHIKEQPAPVMPAELHPDTQNLVANFSTALAEKLYGAQLKYGYDADWKQDGWATQCLAHFHQHIAKGDPRDVAAYCAFMWYHGWKTESVSGPVVPEEIPKGLAGQIVSLLAHNIGDKFLAQKIWRACRATLLQSKYRDLSQPVDPQISEYEKIMLRAGWVMVPVEPTDEMIAAAMNCEDVLFNSDESFCVQFGNIYEAMLAAAPQPEISDGK